MAAKPRSRTVRPFPAGSAKTRLMAIKPINNTDPTIASNLRNVLEVPNIPLLGTNNRNAATRPAPAHIHQGHTCVAWLIKLTGTQKERPIAIPIAIQRCRVIGGWNSRQTGRMRNSPENRPKDSHHQALNELKNIRGSRINTPTNPMGQRKRSNAPLWTWSLTEVGDAARARLGARRGARGGAGLGGGAVPGAEPRPGGGAGGAGGAGAGERPDEGAGASSGLSIRASTHSSGLGRGWSLLALLKQRRNNSCCLSVSRSQASLYRCGAVTPRSPAGANSQFFIRSSCRLKPVGVTTV